MSTIRRIAGAPSIGAMLDATPVDAKYACATTCASVSTGDAVRQAGSSVSAPSLAPNRHDGVGHCHSYRADPPAGVFGWYADLRARARERQPELVVPIEAALAELEAFED